MAQAAAEYIDLNITDEMLEDALNDGRLSIETPDGDTSPDAYTYIVLRDGDYELILHPMPTYSWGDWIRADHDEQIEWARKGLSRAVENRSNMTDDELIDWLDILF